MTEQIKNRIAEINQGRVPEGYKKTPIGVIPEEWEDKTLSDIGDFYKGKGIPGNKLQDDGVPCIGYGDIYMKYNYHFEKAVNFVDQKTANESQPIQKGTLLFTGSGETAEEIGKCVCYNGDEIIYAGGDIILYNSDVNPLFISYQQSIEPSVKEKAKLAQGHSVVHIYADRLGKLPVAYPKNEHKQQKIAEILMKWDDAIALQEKLIEKLEVQKKALMQRLLNPQKNWKKTKIGELVQEKTKRNKNDCQNVLSVSNRYGFIKQEEQFSKQVASADVKNYKVINKGDIAYNPSRINVGSIALYENEEPGIVSPMYIVIECKKINPTLLLLLLNTSKGKYNIESFLSGSVRDSLNYSDLAEIEVHLPDDIIADKIINLNKAISKQLLVHQQKLNAIKLQQKSLMQLLLTGIVSVSE